MSKRLKRQVIGAVPWSVAEGLVNGLAGLALTFVLAWFLEPTEVGQATIALAIVGVIEIIAGIGLVEALVGARSGDTLVSDTAFTAVFPLAVVAGAACWFLAEPIGRFYEQPHVTELVQVAALILPVNALAAIPTGLLVRKMRAATLTLRMTTGRVVTIVATAVLAYLHYGAWALVLGTLAGSCANVAVLAPAISRWPRARFSKKEFGKLVRFGAAFSIERLLWGLMPRLFWLVVGYVHGPATLGYFQFAQRLIDETANLVQTFSIRFGLSFFAALERARKDPTAAFLKATRLITAVGAPVFVGLALVMPDLVGTIFSTKWAPAIIVSQVAALGWILSFPRVLVGPVLRARGHQGGLVLYASFAFAVTIVAGSLTGGHGLLAVGLAWVVRHFIGVPWGFYAIDRYLGIAPGVQISACIRPIIAAALMAGAVAGTALLLGDVAPLKRLIAEIAVGAAAYAIIIVLIDRTTVDLIQGLWMDMRRLKKSA